MKTTVEKLALIRAALQQNSIDIYLIPSGDPHLGEYIPDHWRIISWLTGFTGSAATVLITAESAHLWTDSRYFLQAAEQLSGSGFELAKQEPEHYADFSEWVASWVKNGSSIAFDGRIFSISAFRKLKKALDGKDITFIDDSDLISALFTNRPKMPSSMAWIHPIDYSGKDRSVKIAGVRDRMKKQNAEFQLLTSPDDIMWLLNIRGSDLPYSPLLLSFALIGKEKLFLFAGKSSFSSELAEELNNQNIRILPYNEAVNMFSDLKKDSSIIINPSTTSVLLYNSIPKENHIIEDISIPARLKTVKNNTEIRNISRVMIKDGVALTKFFYWFMKNLGKIAMSEISIAKKLYEFRSLRNDFLGPSFPTIAAFNGHSALPHYTPAIGSNAVISGNGILLIDSGGQYKGGTTDITRTIATGIPTVRQKTDFTLVLKGHINLAMAKFPLGTKGSQLDILARKPLWENGLNYGHGTGHGVGYCLNVHEGPVNINPSVNKTVIESGMLISNEPAIYREGEYGIRTENLMISFEDEETEFGHFLKFDTVSLCFIDKSLIEKTLLDPKEINWLDDYHSVVCERLSPFLSADEKNWLLDKTAKL